MTLAVFFLSPEAKVYARYGGRDAQGPDGRQTPAGLRYTMQSVLQMHASAAPEYAPREPGAPRYIQQIPGGQRYGLCLHCHQVKEIVHEELKRTGAWRRDLAWRYPLPEQLGLALEVARGNVVERVVPGSPAAQAGLQRGDTLRQLHDVPLHSQADVQFALDRAPSAGKVALTWERAGGARRGELTLAPGWRKQDITWRPSLQALIPYLPLDGIDLSAAEKAALGVPVKVAAFRQRARVHSRAQEAGIRAGDVILGIDGRSGLDELRELVRREYLVGDRVVVELLREGTRLRLPLTLP